MPNAATSEKEPAPVNLSGRIAEFAVVSSIVLVVSLILWWRFLPLPHQDLNFYTEPAFMLAKFGKLAGPGSQYVDLTYQKGIYNYPPGHFLMTRRASSTTGHRLLSARNAWGEALSLLVRSGSLGFCPLLVSTPSY